LAREGGEPVPDYWRDMKATTRKFCKGWGANVNSQIKREKSDLLKKLQDMDGVANERGLDASQWQERYEVEDKLEKIYQFEEIQWQRRGSVNWILKGDSNNGYCHNIANGRKKKCTNFSLEDGDREIRDPIGIREHVETFYKDLFGDEGEVQSTWERDSGQKRGG
jgi:hypothetical protein